MSFYESLQSELSWRLFLQREASREFNDYELVQQIGKILDEKSYEQFTENFLYSYELPRKVSLSEYNTSKKRIVYVYPELHRLVLKFTSFYMLKRYNNIFSPNSLAYTEGKSVKSAFNILKKYKISNKDTIYKVDFSDYFNSINIDLLEPKLNYFLSGDPELFAFIMSLLREKKVRLNKKIIEEDKKGVMAGSPIAGILANIFMHDVDKSMLKSGYKYIRYADDVMLVGEEALKYFMDKIAVLDVHLNPKKTEVMNIDTGITFLGFTHIGDITDMSEKAVAKMKSRFKRRAKWYRVWMIKNKVKKEVAIRDYIKKINFKLFSDQEDSINWSRWYLPNINTTKSVKYLEDYFINCIRYLDSGTWKRGKRYYRLSYKDIKNLGYKSLLNEYYKIRRHNGKKMAK